jgi:hypothetical protein
MNNQRSGYPKHIYFRLFLPRIPSPAYDSTIRYNEPMARDTTPDQEIWVTTREGSEHTGYNSEYLEQLARKNSRLLEDERVIKIRKRSGRYELWLPDLLRYIKEIGNGPQLPHQS